MILQLIGVILISLSTQVRPLFHFAMFILLLALSSLVCFCFPLVIILFICDIDEYFYGAYKAASSFCTDGEEDRTPSLLEQQIAALTERNRLLEEQNTISQQSLNAVLEQNKLLLDQNKLLLGKNVGSQDKRTNNGDWGNNNEGNGSVIGVQQNF